MFPEVWCHSRWALQFPIGTTKGNQLTSNWAQHHWRWTEVRDGCCITLLRQWLQFEILSSKVCYRRSQWPRGLRRGSAAARLLRSWVPIPLGSWMFVCCECCVLSGRGLCDELITRPEESYRLWCVVVCDLETSRMWRPWPALGRSATEKKIVTGM